MLRLLRNKVSPSLFVDEISPLWRRLAEDIENSFRDFVEYRQQHNTDYSFPPDKNILDCIDQSITNGVINPMILALSTWAILNSKLNSNDAFLLDSLLKNKGNSDLNTSNYEMQYDAYLRILQGRPNSLEERAGRTTLDPLEVALKKITGETYEFMRCLSSLGHRMTSEVKGTKNLDEAINDFCNRCSYDNKFWNKIKMIRQILDSLASNYRLS